MSARDLREALDRRQIGIYLGAIMTGAAIAWLVPGISVLEAAINIALAVMLFLTFLQVPLADLGRAVAPARFMAALLTANFAAIPLLVAALLPLLPADPMARLGVLLVLLTPCIDYVVTFSRLARADARLLLAATPVLLLLQMALLPVYLNVFLGEEAARMIRPEPFMHALHG